MMINDDVYEPVVPGKYRCTICGTDFDDADEVDYDTRVCNECMDDWD